MPSGCSVTLGLLLVLNALVWFLLWVLYRVMDD